MIEQMDLIDQNKVKQYVLALLLTTINTWRR